MQWTDADSGGRGVVAAFDALVVAADGALRHRRWAYLLDPDSHVVVAGRQRLSVPHGPDAAAALDARTWCWVTGHAPRGRP